jgi:hypothetical protein
MTALVRFLARVGYRGEARQSDARVATAKESRRDVDDSNSVATVTDPDGNVLGLLQDR